MSQTLESPPLPSPATRAVASPWILNGWQDLLLFIGTPLLLIPVVALTQQHFSPLEFRIWVGGLGAMGHHLPGMMRAYGDRELFRRFRVRFVVAPVALSIAAAVCVYNDLAALSLVLLLWGMWHGIAQLYGFARIYDAKVKSFAPLTARLDLMVLTAWFLTALLTDLRMPLLLRSLYQCGLPLLSPGALSAIRIAAWCATALVTLAFCANALGQRRRGETLSGSKMLLLATGIAFWWYTSVGIPSVLISIVLNELFHDVQYLAIVWIYNRKRVNSGREVGAFTRYLFRNSGAMIGLYVGLVVAYGLPATQINAVGKTAQQFMGVLIATSTLLHFYFDGFIWKVRERTTSEGLGLAGRTTPEAGQAAAVQAAPTPAPASAATEASPQGSSHALKWGVLGVLAAGMVALQFKGPVEGLARSQNIAALAPGSFEAHFDLAGELSGAGRPAEARQHLERALQIDPSDAEAHYELGRILLQQGQPADAADQLRRSLKRTPRSFDAQLAMGRALSEMGDAVGAVEHLRQAVELKPGSIPAHMRLGEELGDMGQIPAAAEQFELAAALEPRDASTLLDLGRDMLKVNRVDRAASLFERALALDPRSAGAHNGLGICLARQGRLDPAIAAFNRALQFDPTFKDARDNLDRALALRARK
ncbi:MAG: tetratricopeptide repeat protein [Planctomycetota bacterium]|nr:tetratricopeptide repeat protein [Planctomycetota bacterium]